LSSPRACRLTEKPLQAGAQPGAMSVELSRSVAAIAAAAAAVSAAAAATTTTLTILRFVHLEGATVEIGAIQRLRGAGSIRIRHFHEAEAAGTIRLTIGDQRDFLDGAVLRKQGTDGLVGRGERKVANV
jgi:hypothetical protein